jgi:hypothetical protein
MIVNKRLGGIGYACLSDNGYIYFIEIYNIMQQLHNNIEKEIYMTCYDGNCKNCRRELQFADRIQIIIIRDKKLHK